MATNHLPIYYNNLLYDCNKFFRRCKKNPGLEDIHQLRVNIKDIRSVMLFADNLSNNKYHFTEQTEQFDPLFKSAGKVREIQLCIKHPTSLKAKHARLFKSFLENEIHHFLTLFNTQLEDFNFETFLSNNEKNIELLGTFTNQSVKNYATLHVEQQHNNLQELINKKSSEKNLHEIRKQLKILIESINFLNSINNDKASNLSARQFETLYKKIGKWHDLTIHTSYFKMFMKTMPDKERKSLQQEKRRLEKIMLQKRRKISGMTRTAGG